MFSCRGRGVEMYANGTLIITERFIVFRFPGSFVNRHHRHRIYSVHGFSTVLSPATIDFPSARFASLRGGVCPVEMEERRTCVGL